MNRFVRPSTYVLRAGNALQIRMFPWLIDVFRILPRISFCRARKSAASIGKLSGLYPRPKWIPGLETCHPVMSMPTAAKIRASVTRRPPVDHKVQRAPSRPRVPNRS